jgi:tRNA threonylcarbamoyladenosine biosynthesis protein TsaE
LETIVIVTDSTEASFEAGVNFADNLTHGDVVALLGDLGAGKTVFTKGLCVGLGCDQLVSSPSYTLVNIYQGKFTINHLDCYRLNSCEDMNDLGPDELLYPDGVTIIEWAEKIKAMLPDNIWVIKIDILDENKRQIKVFRNRWPS